MKLTRTLSSTLGTAMLAGALMFAPQAAEARVFISVGFAPPAIPVYDQPVCPGDGYIWTPGYWQYTDDGYEWTDGAWVVAPYTGALWTPGYWGYGGSGYFWNAGYWGPSIGYYGGINYGFGYFGTGFYGGYWNSGHFFYNREYNHFDRGRNYGYVYNRHVDGFDGRPGGSSFARGIGNDRRGGTFNNVSRGGFGQSGFNQNNNGRVANDNSFNNRQSLNQPGTQGGQFRGGPSSGGYGNNVRPAQPGNQFGGFNNGGRSQAANPASSFHPGRGSNPGGSGGQPRGNPSGGQAPGGGSSAPHGGGGAPHGGGGSHGGGHR